MSPRAQLIGNVMAALLIIASLMSFSSPGSDNIRVNHNLRSYEMADYRYLAETFWQVPHDEETYSWHFRYYFTHYLDNVPLRGILPGTFMIALKAISFAPDYDWDYRWIFAGSLKLMVLLSTYLVYLACMRRYGVYPALLVLATLLFPSYPSWLYTENIHMGEPVLRTLLLLMLAAMIWFSSSGRFAGAAYVMLLALLAAHVKSYWLLLGLFMAAAWLVAAVMEKWAAWRAFLVLGLALLIPASVLGVNAVGWHYPTLTPGIGLHYNLKTNGAFLNQLCAERAPDILPLCRKETYGGTDIWWRMYVGRDVPPSAFHALDAHARAAVTSSAIVMQQEFMDGFKYASIYPLSPRPWPVARILVEGLVWIGLLFGLTRRRTAPLSALGLAVWVVPAISNLFASVELRDYIFSAGIPLSIVWIATLDAYLSRMKHDG